MALTTAQQATFKNDVLADPAFADLPQNSDGAFAIVAAYQVQAAPNYVVWKTSVSNEEILRNGMDWTRVDNLGAGPARIWEWMMQFGTFNPAKPNIRAGIEAVWKGTAADLAVRAAVYGHCKRNANRLEKLFATGLGTDASPSTMTVDGVLSYADVQNAMGW